MCPRSLTDSEVLYDRDAESGREDVVAEVIANTLRIHPTEIEKNMEEVYVTKKGGNIMWIVGEESLSRRFSEVHCR